MLGECLQVKVVRPLSVMLPDKLAKVSGSAQGSCVFPEYI